VLVKRLKGQFLRVLLLLRLEDLLDKLLDAGQRHDLGLLDGQVFVLVLVGHFVDDLGTVANVLRLVLAVVQEVLLQLVRELLRVHLDLERTAFLRALVVVLVELGNLAFQLVHFEVVELLDLQRQTRVYVHRVVDAVRLFQLFLQLHLVVLEKKFVIYLLQLSEYLFQPSIHGA
jgi:hypothetical protein